MLAFSSVRDDVPAADVARDLERLSHEAQAADQPALAATAMKAHHALVQAAGAEDEAAVRGELSEALVDFVATSSDPVGLEPAPAESSPVEPIALDFGLSTTSAALAQDDEMREIFLEEAREVLTSAETARAELAAAPEDLAAMTTLRRAFHTLKGSSRMVGLKNFGEAAWACEQLYNTHLADQSPAPAGLVDFTTWALGYLGAWVDDVSAGRRGAHDAGAVIDAANRVGAPEASHPSWNLWAKRRSARTSARCPSPNRFPKSSRPPRPTSAMPIPRRCPRSTSNRWRLKRPPSPSRSPSS